MPSRVLCPTPVPTPSLIPHHLHDIHNQALRRHHIRSLNQKKRRKGKTPNPQAGLPAHEEEYQATTTTVAIISS
ncbi:hypothetical protein VTJ04DRAFT_3020 [Mycothermus thermophilus]|uniref:uncharacterized protein n=1 Tax=Humicola insolens TaxID=85995 RepID=UPI00374396BF